MNDTFSEDLIRENELLKREIRILTKARPQSKVRYTLYDKMLDFLLKSETLKCFCDELEENQSTVDMRNIKVSMSYKQPQTKNHIWHKYPDGSATMEHIDAYDDIYPEITRKSKNLQRDKDHLTGNSELYYDE